MLGFEEELWYIVCAGWVFVRFALTCMVLTDFSGISDSDREHIMTFCRLLGVSLLFSTSVTILLMSILIGAIWQQLRGATLRYEQLH